MELKKDLLATSHLFRSADAFRQSMNETESIPDLVQHLSYELMKLSDGLPNTPHDCTVARENFSGADIARLRETTKNRTLYRLDFSTATKTRHSNLRAITSRSTFVSLSGALCAAIKPSTEIEEVREIPPHKSLVGTALRFAAHHFMFTVACERSEEIVQTALIPAIQERNYNQEP